MAPCELPVFPPSADQPTQSLRRRYAPLDPPVCPPSAAMKCSLQCYWTKPQSNPAVTDGDVRCWSDQGAGAVQRNNKEDLGSLECIVWESELSQWGFPASCSGSCVSITPKKRKKKDTFWHLDFIPCFIAEFHITYISQAFSCNWHYPWKGSTACYNLLSCSHAWKYKYHVT